MSNSIKSLSVFVSLYVCGMRVHVSVCDVTYLYCTVLYMYSANRLVNTGQGLVHNPG